TKITSNNPVAVNTGSWCGSANTGNAQDIGIDQIVPVNFVGNEYIAVKGEGTTLGEQIVVIATSDETHLYVNGVLEHTFAQQGDYYIIGRDKYHSINNNMYINADDNIYVYQTLSGQNSDVSVGLCFLPPLSCLSNREVNISYANKIGNPILSLITEIGADVTINGITITQTPKSVEGNSDWVTYEINSTDILSYNNPPTTFEIVSSKAINAALAFQSGVIGGAGYYSGFGISPSLQAAPTVEGTEACFPNNASLKADNYDEYIWYYNGEVIDGAVSDTLTPTKTGQYRVSGHTGCGMTKASDPYTLKTCLTLEGGGVFPEDEGDVMVILRLGLVSEDDVSYWYRTQSASATGEDFTYIANKRTIKAGDLFDTVYVEIIVDAKYESVDEKFIFDVYASENATVKNEMLEFFIQDNDPKPTVAAPASVTVQEDGDTLKISFVKNGATQETLSFNYATENGTASAGNEFKATSGLVEFGPDEYLKYIYVPIINNDINNYASLFALRYSNANSVTLVNTTTNVTINDDEETSTCLNLVKVTDGVEEGDAIQLNVHLARVEGIDITYKLILNNMTTDSADFTPISSQVYTLKAGVTDTTFWIQTLEDTLPETDETFAYSLVDVTGGASCTGEIELKIYNDDYIPTLNIDNYVVVEDASMVGNVLDNDVILGDTPVVVAFVAPLKGNFTDKGKGAFSYTPLADFFGVIDFSYTVTDQSGDRRASSVNIEVTNDNDLPIAINDTIETQEDSVVFFFPMVNDIDVDHSTLTLASVSGAKLGSARIENDCIIYTPKANIFGSDTLAYFITDGQDDGATANVYLTIKASNDVPIAYDNNYTLTEGDAAQRFDVLANDKDIDLRGISILRIYDVSGGTATIVDDKIDYLLFDNFWGDAQLSYTLVDGDSDSASAEVNITVTPVNDVPVAITDIAVTNEDVAVAIDVLSNDIDDDARGLDLDSMSVPTHGSLSVLAGIITYTPNADYCGVDSFIYYMSDYNDDVASAKVDLIINCMGEAPVAGDDNYALVEDGPISIWDVMSNDADKDNSGISITSIYGVTSGSATIVMSETRISYTLAANFNGNAAFNYVITDGEGDRDTASVSISVASVVDLPSAHNDLASTNEDQSVDISPLDNDVDIEIAGFNVDSLGTAMHGSLVEKTNVITYTPTLNYCGRDSFAYRILDNNGKRSTAWTTITVDCVPDCPVAKQDAYIVDEDATMAAFDVKFNDVDIDGDGFYLSQIVSVSSGVASIVSDKIDYSPAANFNGNAQLEYEISNASGDKDTALVQFTINAVNDLPVAVRDIAVTNEDIQAVINVLNNDEDIDSSSISIKSVDVPLHGTANFSGTNIVYQPKANFNGVDSFLYHIEDGDTDKAQAMVVVTVNSVNDAPVIVKDTVNASEDLPQLFNPITNDLAPDNGGLSMVSISIPEHGAITSSTGQYLYTAEANFNGVDSVLYTIKDAQGDQSSGWVMIYVASENDLPLANADLGITNEDAVVSVDVLYNDKDIDKSIISLYSVAAALHGTVIIKDKKLEYTPDSDFYGQDSFLYTIADGEGDRASAQLKITVNSISDMPTAVNDLYALTEDDAKAVFDVLFNDIDPDKKGLRLHALFGASGGLAQMESNKVAYTLNANFYGKDTITYVLKDVDNDLDTAFICLTIVGEDDLPIATNDTVSINEDNSIVVAVLGNDVNLDAGTLTVGNITVAQHGSYVLSANKISYTPRANYFGRDSFQYTITDGDGDEATAQLLIIINSVNDVPVAHRDTVNATEDEARVFTPMVNDVNPDLGALSIVNMTAATHGAITYDSGNYMYTPNANYNGQDSVIYTIADTQGDESMALVVFKVVAVDDVPLANNDRVITNEDNALTIEVLSNDEDLDGGILLLKSVDVALHGTPKVVGKSISYQPMLNFSGRDSFIYHIEDADGNKASATVVVVVNSGNDAPVTAPDYVIATEDIRLEFNPLSNDTDPDAGGLRIINLGTPKHGTLETLLGKYYYTSNANFNGQDSVQYTVADKQDDQSMNWIFISVEAANDDPIAQPDQTVMSEDASVVVNVLDNDEDIDNSGLRIETLGLALHGTTSIVDEKITYAPDANFFGLDSFVYTILDGEDNASQARVKVTVNAVSDLPIAHTDSYVILEDASKTLFDVLSNDTDLDNDTLIIDQVYGAHGGFMAIESTILAYTPKVNFNGKDTVYYVVRNAQNDVDTSQVFLSVTAQNDAPVGHRDAATTSEDVAVEIDVLINDEDIDAKALKVDRYDDALHGTITLFDNKLTYTPKSNFFGRDSFVYYLSDFDNDPSQAVVVVEVNSTNEAPITVKDTVWATEDVALNFAPMDNDLNPDGGVLRMLNMTAAENGAITEVAGEYTYISDANFYGKDSVSYTVEDEQKDQSMSWVYFNVAAANDLPLALLDIIFTDEDEPIEFAVLGNDTDVDRNIISLDSVADALNGKASMVGGKVSYLPNNDYYGVDSFLYYIKDHDGDRASAFIYMTIHSVSDAPVAHDDAYALVE
ncbi:MAG: tandem-95 repeat protein, partial [Bacteroidales bacterium]|nr:tandem-95 repeat protein [Bacteroidales bacterium]